MQRPYKDLPGQSPILFLRAFGPCTLFPFPCVLFTLLFPPGRLSPSPDLLLLAELPPVAEVLSARASLTLTLAPIFM